MSHTIQIDLADDVLLGMQKDERTMAAELRLAAAVKWYECGVLSQEKAAEVAGMTTPLVAVEQITYLFFIRQLEGLDREPH